MLLFTIFTVYSSRFEYINFARFACSHVTWRLLARRAALPYRRKMARSSSRHHASRLRQPRTSSRPGRTAVARSFSRARQSPAARNSRRNRPGSTTTTCLASMLKTSLSWQSRDLHLMFSAIYWLSILKMLIHIFTNIYILHILQIHHVQTPEKGAAALLDEYFSATVVNGRVLRGSSLHSAQTFHKVV